MRLMPSSSLFLDRDWTICNIADYLLGPAVQEVINAANFVAAIVISVLRLLRHCKWWETVTEAQDSVKGQC